MSARERERERQTGRQRERRRQSEAESASEGPGTHAGDVVVRADALGEKPVPDLPGEDRGALALVVRDLGDHVRRRHPGLGAADGPGLDGARLVVPAGEEEGGAGQEGRPRKAFGAAKRL